MPIENESRLYYSDALAPARKTLDQIYLKKKMNYLTVLRVWPSVIT